MINQQAGQRHYTCQISGKQKTITDIEDEFPVNCPNCGAKWPVHDSRVFNGAFDTTGRGAYCRGCKACRFEVIDVPTAYHGHEVA